MIVNLELPQGVTLTYLRGPNRGYWEALVRQPLPPEHENTLRFAVGFGSSRDPDHALTYALLALEHDAQIETQLLAQPTCDTASLNLALSNLLGQPAPMSPPRFKLKV
jgi:hypothetical protein